MVLAATGLFAQTVEKTLVRSFNLQNSQEVALQLDAPVEVQTWDQKIMRIQMNVRLERGSESMLRSLVQAGRYNIKGELIEGQYVVNVPGLAREVLVNSSALPESISYIISVPEGVHIDLQAGSSVSVF